MHGTISDKDRQMAGGEEGGQVVQGVHESGEREFKMWWTDGN